MLCCTVRFHAVRLSRGTVFVGRGRMCLGLFWPAGAKRQYRSADFVDPVRIESDIFLDLFHRFKRGLISPHRIDRAVPASRNAVVGRLAFVWAEGRVFAPRERRHIDILAGDILNGRIGGLAKRQGIACVGDNLSADGDQDAGGVRFDRDRVVGTRYLHSLFCGHDMHR